MKKDHRYIYILHIIIIVGGGLLLNQVYNFTDNAQNTAAFVATVSELLGLSIALTELFFVSQLTQKIVGSIDNLHKFSELTLSSSSISQIREDLVSAKYGKAVLRLEKVRDSYHQSIDQSELLTTTSIHRTNYDKINSIISKLSMFDDGQNKSLPRSDVQDAIAFLTSFSETITSLKLKHKQSIL